MSETTCSGYEIETIDELLVEDVNVEYKVFKSTRLLDGTTSYRFRSKDLDCGEVIELRIWKDDTPDRAVAYYRDQVAKA